MIKARQNLLFVNKVIMLKISIFRVFDWDKCKEIENLYRAKNIRSKQHSGGIDVILSVSRGLNGAQLSDGRLQARVVEENPPW